MVNKSIDKKYLLAIALVVISFIIVALTVNGSPVSIKNLSQKGSDAVQSVQEKDQLDTQEQSENKNKTLFVACNGLF